MELLYRVFGRVRTESENTTLMKYWSLSAADPQDYQSIFNLNFHCLHHVVINVDGASFLAPPETWSSILAPSNYVLNNFYSFVTKHDKAWVMRWQWKALVYLFPNPLTQGPDLFN